MLVPAIVALRDDEYRMTKNDIWKVEIVGTKFVLKSC